jgi:hypothetical protein
MPSSTRMPPRTLPCHCRVRDDYSAEECNTLVGDHWYVPHPPRRAHVLKTRTSQRDRSTTMIKDILVVLTVTSAIVVIGLALFNRPARSQEIKPINPVLRNVVSSPKELRAILPPIEYDKPYDRVIIHEAKDIWAIRELCKLKSVITVACALLINGTCTTQKEIIIDHGDGLCSKARDVRQPPLRPYWYAASKWMNG